MDFYIIDEYYNPILENDHQKWIEFWANNDEKRSFLRTKVGCYTVYTSFLTIDHGFGDTGPLLFETMIHTQNGGWLEYQERCFSPDDAVNMHRKALNNLFYLRMKF